MNVDTFPCPPEAILASLTYSKGGYTVFTFFTCHNMTVGYLEKTCAMICKWKAPVTPSHTVLPSHTSCPIMLIYSFMASLIISQQFLNTAL